jgi:hypothetical protein
MAIRGSPLAAFVTIERSHMAYAVKMFLVESADQVHEVNTFGPMRKVEAAQEWSRSIEKAWNNVKGDAFTLLEVQTEIFELIPGESIKQVEETLSKITGLGDN